ncbi:hypothetical protein AVEN_254290-1 [Araneus ventricosus]|uniref:Uncharacterized protein n=1 Tax=Araneus ventricosus TaxID=182803 RepID=A0A4Y2FAX9_ARAVE|nr:hypothetical protein AVEN_254290-1 [Araneus ventricosus]
MRSPGFSPLINNGIEMLSAGRRAYPIFSVSHTDGCYNYDSVSHSSSIYAPLSMPTRELGYADHVLAPYELARMKAYNKEKRNTYLEQDYLQDRDVKTAAENWLNGQCRDFYQAELNKLVLRSDKCLNRFDDYVGK